MKSYWRILTYVKPFWAQVLFHLISVVISVTLLVSSIALVEPIINLIFLDEPVGAISSSKIMSINYLEYVTVQIVQRLEDNPGNKQPALLFAILTIVAINIIGNFFRYLGSYFMANVRTKVIQYLREDVFGKVSWLQIAYFEGERKGDIMTRLTADVQEIENSIVVSLQSIIKEPFTIIAFLTFMMISSVQLTMFIFILLPIVAILISFIAKSLKKNATKTQAMLSWIMIVIDEFMTGVRVVKAFRAEKYVQNVFKKYNSRYSVFARRQFHKQNLISPISETFGVLTIGIFLWFGGKLVFNGSIEAASIITFVFYFQQIIAPTKNLTSAFGSVMKGVASADRLFKLKDSPLLIKDIENPKELTTFNSEIKYNQVSFGYNNQDVLKNINITLPRGQIIALVGESGSGKTTLVELLFRFYDVRQGSISIDGVDIRDLKLSNLRGLMAIVTQEAILFNDTIYNNISFGINAKEEDVINAAKAANAHEFIMETEDGYQTNIGDRGGLLSGGQRQRLSIARAILKNPPILVLDEATSSLDTSSEQIVQDALFRLMKNRTSIVIAHRLSTIQNADKIYVLDKGEIAEQGTHSELIKNSNIYKRLSNLQNISRE